MSQSLGGYRWLVLAIFVLSTVINYLDRMALSALGPAITADLHLNKTSFGVIVTAFAVTYAAAAPFAGLLIDRMGLNRTISIAVALWSAAGIATGFVGGLGGLIACRALLGVAEAAGIPAAAKAIHQHLESGERALGNAANQVAVSLGAVLAPPLTTWIAARYGWRSAFVATGIAGLAWIPIWNAVARRTSRDPVQRSATDTSVLRDPRLWAFVAANAISMIGYWVWTTWTTFYLTDTYRLTLVQANSFAWIPPVFAGVGGLGGGWLSLRLVQRGVAPAPARFRVCLIAALLSLASFAILAAPTAVWASAGISLSFMAVAAFSVNMYTLPLDVFGGSRAAFAVSMLVASYGAMQLVIGTPAGWIIDHHGYMPLIAASALAPLAACAILWRTRSAV